MGKHHNLGQQMALPIQVMDSSKILNHRCNSGQEYRTRTIQMCCSSMKPLCNCHMQWLLSFGMMHVVARAVSDCCCSWAWVTTLSIYLCSNGQRTNFCTKLFCCHLVCCKFHLRLWLLIILFNPNHMEMQQDAAEGTFSLFAELWSCLLAAECYPWKLSCYQHMVGPVSKSSSTSSYWRFARLRCFIVELSWWGWSATEMCVGTLLFRTFVRITQGTAEGNDIRECLVNHLMVYRLIQV